MAEILLLKLLSMKDLAFFLGPALESNGDPIELPAWASGFKYLECAIMLWSAGWDCSAVSSVTTVFLVD